MQCVENLYFWWDNVIFSKQISHMFIAAGFCCIEDNSLETPFSQMKFWGYF